MFREHVRIWHAWYLNTDLAVKANTKICDFYSNILVIWQSQEFLECIYCSLALIATWRQANAYLNTLLAKVLHSEGNLSRAYMFKQSNKTSKSISA